MNNAMSINRNTRKGNRWIMITLFIIHYSLFISPARAQYVATVIDAVTHERLPFASVWVDGATSTITNAVGTFSLHCEPADVLRITYGGYKAAYVVARQLGEVVALQPQERQLQEVVVVPIGPMINKICKETLRLQQKYKNRESKFFYRQTAFLGARCYEFAESFLKGNPAVSLRNLSIYTGRYAGIQSDSLNHYTYFGNFYTFSQLEMAAYYKMPSKLDDVVPLFRNYNKFYNVSYTVISGDDGERIFAIRFEPKPEVLSRYSILGGTLYVDEQTLHIRRFEGEGHNFRVLNPDRDKRDRVQPLRAIRLVGPLQLCGGDDRGARLPRGAVGICRRVARFRGADHHHPLAAVQSGRWAEEEGQPAEAHRQLVCRPALRQQK